MTGNKVCETTECGFYFLHCLLQTLGESQASVNTTLVLADLLVRVRKTAFFREVLTLGFE